MVETTLERLFMIVQLHVVMPPRVTATAVYHEDVHDGNAVGLTL